MVKDLSMCVRLAKKGYTCRGRSRNFERGYPSPPSLVNIFHRTILFELQRVRQIETGRHDEGVKGNKLLYRTVKARVEAS